MNKQQREELEDMVRQLAEEPYNPSEAHIEEIKRQAFEEYDQIMAAKQKMKEKRKSIRRRVVVTAAVIVCLLIGSTVIALLNPLQSGNADNFFRRAVIWVNDQLHLGIELPALKEENKAQFEEDSIISSISEVAETIDFPIVYLKETQDLHFDLITKEEEPLLSEITVTLRYTTPDGMIRIINKTGSDFNTISTSLDEAITVLTPIGNIIVFQTEGFNRGLLIIDNVTITIIGAMPIEVFSNYCESLLILN